jgi:DNA repair exonuclease SbcCD nuclease subunit
MKIGFFTDTHLSGGIGLAGGNQRLEDGRPRSLRDAEQCFLWMRDQFEVHDVDCVAFGGDLFDRRNPTPDEYAVALDAMHAFSESWPTLIIPGNHDGMMAKSASAVLPIERLAKHRDHLRVFSMPDRLDFRNLDGSDPVRFYFLPYPKTGAVVGQDEQEFGSTREDKNGVISRGLNAIVANMAQDAREFDGNTILVSHITFAGSKFNEHQSVPMTDVQVSTEHLPWFDFVLAGHIHKHQQIGQHERAWFVSPPDRWTFGDEGDFRGIAIVDTDTLELEFVPYPAARRFLTISPSEAIGFLDAIGQANLGGEWPSALIDPSSSTFLRVKGEVDTLEEYDRVVELLELLSGDLGAVQNDVKVKRDEAEVAAVEPDQGIEAVFDAYLEDRPDEIPEDIAGEVLEVVQELTKQARGI